MNINLEIAIRAVELYFDNYSPEEAVKIAEKEFKGKENER